MTSEKLEKLGCLVTEAVAYLILIPIVGDGMQLKWDILNVDFQK